MRAMDQRTAISVTDGDVSDINNHFRPLFHGGESNAHTVTLPTMNIFFICFTCNTNYMHTYLEFDLANNGNNEKRCEDCENWYRISRKHLH